MSNYQSTKLIELGSCAFRQYGAKHSHCQYLHGYQLKAKFWFGGSKLDERNWLVDFGGLKELKTILVNQFDHTLCIAADDPCIELFKQLETAGACVLRIMPNGVGIERAAEWCYNAAAAWIKKNYGDRCWVDKVEVFEHDNNSATYINSEVNILSVSNLTDYKISTNNTTITHSDAVVVPAPVYTSAAASNSTIVEPTTTPAPIDIQPFPEPPPQTGARVGPGQVTQGWSNPFGGTSWGV